MASKGSTFDPSQYRLWPKANYFESFEVGQVFEHHWGRTLTESDTITFSTTTQSYNPIYFNRPLAIERGHPDIVVNPMLVFGTVFGMSVEDLSESGGLFLGVDDLEFDDHVYPGDTLVAKSVVTDIRESGSRPDYGIVTWETEGVNQEGKRVVRFLRTNFVAREHTA